MKKIIVATGATIIVVVVAVAYGPGMLNEYRYRSAIEQASNECTKLATERMSFVERAQMERTYRDTYNDCMKDNRAAYNAVYNRSN